MDQFVCVRMIRTSGMDLSVFQFNWWSTWTVFLMNSDRVTYGRYGRKEGNSTVALRKALEATLELHKNYPANKELFQGKKGLPLPWKTPEDVPVLKERYGGEKPRRNDCIHCHHVWEGIMSSLIDEDRPIPERYSADYPTTERMGLVMETDEVATVYEVKKASPAEAAGLKAGDKILWLAGQPILSIADVEWVLYVAENEATLKAELQRDGKRLDAVIKLPRGWRTR